MAMPHCLHCWHLCIVNPAKQYSCASLWQSLHVQVYSVLRFGC
jgi:hypothetical protein